MRKAWVQRRGAGLAYNWEQRVITKEKKERIKNIIEKNRSKKPSERAYLIFCKVYFFKGWALLLLTQGTGFP